MRNLAILYSSSHHSSLSSLEDVGGEQTQTGMSEVAAPGAAGDAHTTPMIPGSSTTTPPLRILDLDHQATVSNDVVVNGMTGGDDALGSHDDGDSPRLGAHGGQNNLDSMVSLEGNMRVTPIASALETQPQYDEAVVEIPVLTWFYENPDEPPGFFLQKVLYLLEYSSHRPNVESILEAMLSQDNSMAERLRTLPKDQYRLATARNPPSEDTLLREGLGWRQRAIHGYEEHGTLSNIKRNATMKPIIRQAIPQTGDIGDVLTMLEIPTNTEVFAVYFIPKVSSPLLSGQAAL